MLMQALLKAVAIGTRVIIVGDSNQLPSVGAGNVLIGAMPMPCSSLQECCAGLDLYSSEPEM